jgi:hypothetical protein
VKGYLLYPESIVVFFNNSTIVYKYNSQKPGLALVLEMHKLAIAGKGLGKFIRTRVYGRYYSKK